MRGVTLCCVTINIANAISTHTPHARRDNKIKKETVTAITFQLTRLMRGVTNTRRRSHQKQFGFQLTRLMRGVTNIRKKTTPKYVISTHTPHARRDFMRALTNYLEEKFQLTRLMRGVTSCVH